MRPVVGFDEPEVALWGRPEMQDDWDEVGELERPRRRRSRTRLTPEERRYREARRRANAKLGFIAHFIAYASVCLFLLFVAGIRPAFIVALAWGIGVVFHYFGTLVAPELRHRLIER